MPKSSLFLISLLILISACASVATPGDALDVTPTPADRTEPAPDTPLPLESAPETPRPITPAVTAPPFPLTEEAIIAPAPSGQSLQPQLANASIDVDQIQVLVPRDAIRAIFPEEVADLMVTAEEAEMAGIDPQVGLIGVSLNGEAQAYPIPFLSRHEIVNAEVGGRLIAATW